MRQIKKRLARRGLSLLLALSLLLILAGCGGQEPDTIADQPVQPQPEEPADVPPESTPEPEPEPEPDPVELALNQYRTIVGQADTYDYDSAGDPTGAYRYALVRMALENDVPALLLEQDTTFGISYVLVFQYDTDRQSVLQADGTLMEGVGSAGGYRGNLSAAGDGNGLLSSEFSSGSGQGSTSRVTLAGATLQSEIIWEGNIFDDTDTVVKDIGSIDINWHDAAETSVLDSWTPDAEPSVSAPAEPSAEPAEPAAPVTDGDRIVFTGTLGSYSYAEVLALQGLSNDPNPGSDQSKIFRLIVLDTPQNMTLRSYDDNEQEGEVSVIDVTNAEGLDQYVGQQLTMSIDPDRTHWPSDSSLPIAQPRTYEVQIIQ